MASDINDITINYEEDGVLIVKEIDKEILSKGAWTTILFRYQQMDRRNERPTFSNLQSPFREGIHQGVAATLGVCGEYSGIRPQDILCT